jgi:hypothetical protein
MAFSVGYAMAVASLNTSRSNIYKLPGGTAASYTITLEISSNTVAITAADRKAILNQGCQLMQKDISQ